MRHSILVLGCGHIGSAITKMLGPNFQVTVVDYNIKALADVGYSTDNLAMGMGGGLLQQLDRDTLKFAMKASYAVVKGEGHDVFKSPIGDSGKKSKAGRVALYKSRLTGEYTTTALEPRKVDGEFIPQMETVFLDGVVTKTYTMNEIRKNTGLW